MYPGLTESLVSWLASGERGVSSNTIVQTLTGVPAASGWRGQPLDPDDMCRCIKLLEACPELAPRIGEMAKVSRNWAALVAHWDEIVALIDEEVPGWRENRHGSAPKAYAFMRRILNSVEHNGEEP